MRLDAPADLARWRGAVEGALEMLGLGVPQFSGPNAGFRAAPPLTIETPRSGIEAHLDAELNRGFSPADLPLRFFAIQEPGGGHWFGIVIDHWLADDFSCRELLQEIFSAYQSPAKRDGAPGLAWVNACPRPERLPAAWIGFLKQMALHRRAFRVPLRNPLDFTANTFRRELPDGAVAAISRLAKPQGATVHDVFLAAAAQTFGAFRKRHPEGPRDAVGIASAMDLRRFESGAAKSGFGFLISQYTIVEPRPEETPLAALVARIAVRTRMLKSGAQTGPFAPALALWRLSRKGRARATLFQRGAPLACGLSNVDLAGSWIEQVRPADYRRVGPAGPIVPIVFMITTLNGRVLIDVTFRTTAFARRDAEFLAGDFANRLTAEMPVIGGLRVPVGPQESA